VAKRTVSALKKKLWKIFAEYIKRKHNTSGDWCNCFTCNKPIKIGTTDCQAGHFFPKGSNQFIMWHEDNVRPQCSYCNLAEQGAQSRFEKALIFEIGQERVDWLHHNRHNTEKRGVVYYEEAIEKYSKLLKEIK